MSSVPLLGITQLVLSQMTQIFRSKIKFATTKFFVAN